MLMAVRSLVLLQAASAAVSAVTSNAGAIDSYTTRRLSTIAAPPGTGLSEPNSNSAGAANGAPPPHPCGFSPCPSWAPTWNITRSTIIMPCNYSGYFDYTIAGKFAVVDYDWSNAKEMWANPKQWGGGLAPDGKMDCQERLLKQAEMTKAHARSLGIDQKVWVYRNLVKALPWYSSVRALLNDSRYSDFFLKFDDRAKPFHVPQCDSNSGRCTEYYHDQTQSPQSGANCSSCKNCGCCVDGACDVGIQPCGE